MSALAVVPAMTDPMGKHWDQPKRDAIEMDDTHALMTRRTFDALKSYDTSFPSGVYDGKMWKRRRQARGSDFLALKFLDTWDVLWYAPSTDPTKCSMHSREIIVIDP